LPLTNLQLMSKVIFSFAFLLFTLSTAHAQFFSLGVKGGMHSQLTNFKDIKIGQGDQAFNLGVDDVKLGAQFGAYLRLGNKFFIQPEVLFNSNRTDFRIEEEGLLNTLIKTERYQNLDIPLLLGVTAGPVRFHLGPVAHYFLNSRSELTDVEGYDERFESLTWGWLAGMTIGKGRISADLRYEGNFNRFGDQISFFGDNYNFSNNPSRLVLALNVALIK
jgi:Outer membrane protein beta-barrel domain